MKVLLVDDERIALEHIRSLIPWEQYGFEIVGTASNGKSALRLYEELRPQIMIVDIRMPVMDGLELIRTAADRKYPVTFIVLSAYEDFDYARKALSLGLVSSYLVKHEVDHTKLVAELDKAKQARETDEKKRRLERSEQLMGLVTGNQRFQQEHNGFISPKPPIGLLLLQADQPFNPVPAASGLSAVGRTFRTEVRIEPLPDQPSAWECFGQFPLGEGRFVAVFEQRNKSVCLLRSGFREMAHAIQQQLAFRYNRPFSCFYTFHEAEADRLPHALTRMETAARHAIFCGKQALVYADELPLPPHIRTTSVSLRGSGRFEDLSAAMRLSDPERIASALTTHFTALSTPYWDLPGLYETIHVLGSLFRERSSQLGLSEQDPFDVGNASCLYHIEDIRLRFLQAIREQLKESRDGGRLSSKLVRALHYIQAHYQEDLNIEDVANAIGISSSYLHQLFKRELGRTFLDYLTEYRVKQAKLILAHEEVKMTEVATRVGYRSPQHFSQVFKRSTGILPHQYRTEGKLL